MGLGLGLGLRIGPTDSEELGISVGDLKRPDFIALPTDPLLKALLSLVVFPDPFSTTTAFLTGFFKLDFSFRKIFFLDWLDNFTSLLAVFKDSNASQRVFS